VPIGMSCHVYPDDDAYLIYFMLADSGNREPSSLPWKNAKAQLAFCQVTQDGDWEGCLRLDRLPTPDEAKAIRETLGIRKRRHLSANQKERARSVLSSARTLVRSAKRPSAHAFGGVSSYPNIGPSWLRLFLRPPLALPRTLESGGPSPPLWTRVHDAVYSG
jgi:hypothetical protein